MRLLKRIIRIKKISTKKRTLSEEYKQKISDRDLKIEKRKNYALHHKLLWVR